MDRRAQGRQYEAAAKSYLVKLGFQAIRENYHCRWGEIDLVMRHGDYLVFVEVRYRARDSLTDGALSVDGRKQQKLCRTGQDYLLRHAHPEALARFDVIALSHSTDGAIEFNHIQNAFECA